MGFYLYCSLVITLCSLSAPTLTQAYLYFWGLDSIQFCALFSLNDFPSSSVYFLSFILEISYLNLPSNWVCFSSNAEEWRFWAKEIKMMGFSRLYISRMVFSNGNWQYTLFLKLWHFLWELEFNWVNWFSRQAQISFQEYQFDNILPVKATRPNINQFWETGSEPDWSSLRVPGSDAHTEIKLGKQDMWVWGSR